MTDPGIVERIARLEPVSLDELKALAAPAARVERRYVVDAEHVVGVLTAVAPDARSLEIDGARDFAYETWYFDTPTLDSYLAAARRRPGRFKVRTRTYVDSGTTWIEAKVRDRRGRTVKHRRPYPLDDRDRLTNAAHGFLASFPAIAPLATDLVPMMRITYRRSTLLLGDARVTVDVEVACEPADQTRRLTARLGGLFVIETKQAAAPSAADHALWAQHARPVPLSKYGVGLAALRPELPSNKWHRTLARHVTVGCEPAALGSAGTHRG